MRTMRAAACATFLLLLICLAQLGSARQLQQSCSGSLLQAYKNPSAALHTDLSWPRPAAKVRKDYPPSPPPGQLHSTDDSAFLFSWLCVGP